MLGCYPLKRPDIDTLGREIREINLHYQRMPDELFQSELQGDLKLNKASNISSKLLSTSKIHKFENLPEPRNATEGIYYI